MKSIARFLSSNKGFTFGVGTLLLFVILKMIPTFADVCYRNFIFQLFRFIWDCTINLLPFSLVYIFIPAIPFILFFYFRKSSRSLVTIFVSLLNLAGIVFSLFMWMWGFNYCCSLVAPLERTTALSKQELFEFGIEIAENLNTTELTVFDDVSSYDNDIVEIGQAVEKQIRMHDIKVWGNPKLRILELTGKLRRLGIAGFYFPFTGQAYVDNTFLATTRNFIIAHELSHSYGIASEAEADFIAYLALKNSNLISVRARYLNYCADLELLRSIRYQLYLLEDAIRLELDSKLNENILTELKAIKLNAAEYPEYFPGMQSTVNDKYLKLMGIEEGVMNYDRFIDLAWEYHHRAR